MKILLTRLTAFVGRHWLRVGLIGCAFFLLSQKEVAIDLRLGGPGGEGRPAASPVEPMEANDAFEPLLFSEERPVLAKTDAGFFSRFDFFSKVEESSRAQRLGKREMDVVAFLDRFAEVARAEQRKYGVPASVVLAASMLYSDAGKRVASLHGNSYFALACGADWSGATMEDNNRCVRGYESAWASFRDFSETVTRGRYTPMRQFDARDYRRWALGLTELGLNGDSQLGADVIALIERYRLDRYDG